MTRHFVNDITPERRRELDAIHPATRAHVERFLAGLDAAPTWPAGEPLDRAKALLDATANRAMTAEESAALEADIAAAPRLLRTILQAIEFEIAQHRAAEMNRTHAPARDAMSGQDLMRARMREPVPASAAKKLSGQDLMRARMAGGVE